MSFDNTYNQCTSPCFDWSKLSNFQFKFGNSIILPVNIQDEFQYNIDGYNCYLPVIGLPTSTHWVLGESLQRQFYVIYDFTHVLTSGMGNFGFATKNTTGAAFNQNLSTLNDPLTSSVVTSSVPNTSTSSSSSGTSKSYIRTTTSPTNPGPSTYLGFLEIVASTYLGIYDLTVHLIGISSILCLILLIWCCCCCWHCFCKRKTPSSNNIIKLHSPDYHSSINRVAPEERFN